MKKLLFLLLCTVSMYGQTLQNPTYGTVKLKQNTTDSAAEKLSVQSADGSLNTIAKTDLINVVERDSYSLLPTTGAIEKLYVTKDTNKLYRWNGTTYVDVAVTDISKKADLVDGKVPLTQINDALLGSVNFKSVYNASTNTPALPTVSSSNKGWYYVVSVAGTQQGLNLAVGDWIISNGTSWGKVDNNNNVTSVNGKVGAVVLSTADVADTTDKRYQTDTQKSNNNATSPVQAQLDDKVSGSGVNGQVSFWSGAKSQSSDSGLAWDNTNKRLSVTGTNPRLNFIGDNYSSFIFLENSGTRRVTFETSPLNNTDENFSLSMTKGGNIQIWNTNYIRNYKQTIIGASIAKNNIDQLQVDGTISASPATLPNQAVVKSQLDAITVPDATTTVKGKIKLAGDLGGTADLPTTPTALHKTGNEEKTGSLTLQSITGDGLDRLIINQSSTSGNSIKINSGSIGSDALLINHDGLKSAISIRTSGTNASTAIDVKNSNVTTASVNSLGVITGTSHVKSGAPTTNLLLAGGGDIAQSAISTADATTTVKGKIKLAGDLGGTADLPTVPKLNAAGLLQYDATDKTVWNNGKGDELTNTSFGIKALRLNSGGLGNSAFGENALSSNSSGSGNTAVGSDALGFSDAGNNTAVGIDALLNSYLGVSNTAIGSGSGKTTSTNANLRDVDKSIFVGVISKALQNGSENEIVIGYDAIGAGSNTATIGNTDITKTVLRGVLVASNIPTYATDVLADAALASGSFYKLTGSRAIFQKP
jgi:hypothetical protein